MAHALYIEDSRGDLTDRIRLCSDPCAQEYAATRGLRYDGWNGCHEVEGFNWCAQCGVTLTALPCGCDTVVINRYRVAVDELCEHGNVLQVAMRGAD